MVDDGKRSKLGLKKKKKKVSFLKFAHGGYKKMSQNKKKPSQFSENLLHIISMGCLIHLISTATFRRFLL